jgi:mRNA interferase MazF
VAGYIPDAGEIIWLQFDPQAGHEQAGHRPAVVLSPKSYNSKAGLLLCCPLTTQIKGYPFEVEIAGKPASAALADQVKSVDYIARNARLKGKVAPRELSAIRAKAIALLGKP